MKVGDMISILSQYPAETEVVCGGVPAGYGIQHGLRDIVKDREVRTILEIERDNVSLSIGTPHLTGDELKRQRSAALDGLADARRSGGTRRFTSIHGDLRIYHNFGGQSDTCYGTRYDPRVFAQLEAEGLIEKYLIDRFGFGIMPADGYRITEAGLSSKEWARK